MKVLRRWLALLALAVLAVLVLMIVYGGTVEEPPALVAPVVIPAANTWTRSANYTTCTQWLDEMTLDQRAEMLRPMLPIMRYTVDTAATNGLELLPSFVDAVSTTCRSAVIGDPSEYVVTAAAAVTFTMDKRFAP